MKIIVVSDIHGKHIDFINLIETNDFDYCFVLGDYCFDNTTIKRAYPTIIFIKGNCDYLGFGLIDLVITLDGVKMYLTHGNKYNVKHNLDSLYKRVKDSDVSLVLYGHTHIYNDSIYDNIRFVNPGAFCDNDYIIIENKEIRREKWTE